MNLKPNLTKLRVLFKGGKHRNALNFPYTHNSSSLPIEPAPLLSTTPMIQGMPGEKTNENWLNEQEAKETKALTIPAERTLDHTQVIFDRYDTLVSNLLVDMGSAAKWNKLTSRPKLLRKRGEHINGWGWVVYRVHSSGEALLPEEEAPQNYTLFNFWQVTFNCGLTNELEPDYQTWQLHALETLEDFERLMPGQVETWLKEQLYKMYKNGCMWVALPELMDERGKKRKPTIEDALFHFNLISFGRNYDPYQTNKHFYDRPYQNNQFIPGHYKR